MLVRHALLAAAIAAFAHADEARERCTAWVVLCHCPYGLAGTGCRTISVCERGLNGHDGERHKYDYLGPCATDSPTDSPTARSTDSPTARPTDSPTDSPTDQPTARPTAAPTDQPTDQPTAQPTGSPTRCETDLTDLDIVWVLDESGSVGRANYELVKRYIIAFAELFPDSDGDSGTRWGLVEFSSGLGSRAAVGAYPSRTEFQTFVAALKYNGGNTNTPLALTQLLTDTLVAPPRREGSKRVVIIVTDGKPNKRGGCPTKLNAMRCTRFLAQQLKTSGELTPDDLLVYLAVGRSVAPGMLTGIADLVLTPAGFAELPVATASLVDAVTTCY
jgi:Mg-chelatase subunit ChlD